MDETLIGLDDFLESLATFIQANNLDEDLMPDEDLSGIVINLEERSVEYE